MAGRCEHAHSGGDLCQGQLEVGFEMFIQTVVDSTCMDFVPPG